MPTENYTEAGDPVVPGSPDAVIRVHEPAPYVQGRRIAVDAAGRRVPIGSPHAAFLFDEGSPQLAAFRARA